MIVFNNISKLKEYLTQDYTKNTLNPVRFINVDSISMWNEVKEFLAPNKFIYLSEFCSADDTMPNLKRLYTTLKNESHSCCVLPLSEFLRVRPDIAEDEIKKILYSLSPEAQNVKIFFLMYRLKSVFKSLKIYDARKDNTIILLDTEEESNYSLTIIQKSLNLKLAGQAADGFKNYLKYWEDKPNKSLHFYTDNAIYLQDQNFFDDVKVIADAFGLLRYHYNLPTELLKTMGTNEDWGKLAVAVAQTGDIHKGFCNELNTDIFKLSLFSNFSAQPNFKQWLLWIWCKIQTSPHYSVQCAKDSNSVPEFIEKLYLGIFSNNEQFNSYNSKKFKGVYAERKEILLYAQIAVPEEFIKKVRNSEKIAALQSLTNISETEKILFFELLRKFRYADYDEILPILHKNFPALAAYLSNYEGVLSAEYQEYFRYYRWLKVTNTLNDNFYNWVCDIADNKGQNVYSLKSRNQIIEEEYSADSAIFFVDAMGVEYLNFLTQMFTTAEFQHFDISYQVGFCNLPSITEYNKDFWTNKNVAADIIALDKLKHSAQSYPENILDELTFLSTLKEKLLAALKDYDKIILCADHGASRLAVLARKSKFDKRFEGNGNEILSGGRFANAIVTDAKIYPRTIVQDDKIIFADYSRFIQQGGIGNEIHGGATLEEWLVPVITIKRRSTPSIPVKINSPSSPNKRRGISANKDFNI